MLIKKTVQAELDEKPYYEYLFLILKDDFLKSQKCLNTIYELIQKSKPVPASTIKEFAGYLHNKESALKKSKEVELVKISNKTIGFFSSYKDYEFVATRFDKIEKKNISFNFSHCIEHCLIQYWATI